MHYDKVTKHDCDMIFKCLDAETEDEGLLSPSEEPTSPKGKKGKKGKKKGAEDEEEPGPSTSETLTSPKGGCIWGIDEILVSAIHLSDHLK